jgi:hypothetical protein
MLSMGSFKTGHPAQKPEPRWEGPLEVSSCFPPKLNCLLANIASPHVTVHHPPDEAYEWLHIERLRLRIPESLGDFKLPRESLSSISFGPFLLALSESLQSARLSTPANLGTSRCSKLGSNLATSSNRSKLALEPGRIQTLLREVLPAQDGGLKRRKLLGCWRLTERHLRRQNTQSFLCSELLGQLVEGRGTSSSRTNYLQV